MEPQFENQDLAKYNMGAHEIKDAIQTCLGR